MSPSLSLEVVDTLQRLAALPSHEMPRCDLQSLKVAMIQHLDRHGYIYMDTAVSEMLFTEIASQLGCLHQRNDIVIDPDRHRQRQQGRRTAAPTVYQTNALDLHTDVANADYLAWYCVEQDEVDGTSLLIDSQSISDHFSAEELTILCSMQHPYVYNTTIGSVGFAYAPVVSQGRYGHQIFFYIPWSLPKDHEAEQANLLKRLSQYVRWQKEHEPIHIRLAKQQCLFIDNHRMLHGRGPLAEGSKRHLVRYYIQKLEP